MKTKAKLKKIMMWSMINLLMLFFLFFSASEILCASEQLLQS